MKGDRIKKFEVDGKNYTLRTLAGGARTTEKMLFVQAIAQLAAYYRRSPDQLCSQEIRGYLHYLLTERHLAWSSCNVVAAAIRFFYVDTLGWTPIQLNLPPRPAQK